MFVSFSTILSALRLTLQLREDHSLPSSFTTAFVKQTFGGKVCPVLANNVLAYGGEFLETSDDFVTDDEVPYDVIKSDAACILPLRYPKKYTYAAGLVRVGPSDDDVWPHVWNLDADGRVVELFPDHGAIAYYGVVVPHASLRAFHNYATSLGERTPLVVDARGGRILSLMGTTLGELLTLRG